MIRLVVAACACLGAVDAVAQRYDVVGQCRSGVPNGGYELRMSDGRLLYLSRADVEHREAEKKGG